MNQGLMYGSARLARRESAVLSGLRGRAGGYPIPPTAYPERGSHTAVESSGPSAEVAWRAWAAGIMDGEGCIHLVRPYRTKPKWTLHVIVVNTDPAMVRKLQEVFGGYVVRQKSVKAGHRPKWRWVRTHAAARSFLRQIRPWLVTKAEQADLAIGLGRLVGGPTAAPEFEAIRQRLDALKREVRS